MVHNLISGSLKSVAVALVAALGVTLNTFGNRVKADIFYISNQNSTKVQTYDSNGTFLGTFVNGPVTTEAVAFDPAGNVYVLGASAGVVEKYSPTGTDLGVYASLNLNSPIAMAFDSGGNLFVSNFLGGGNVIKFGPGGAPSTIFGDAGTNAHGLVLDGAGNVYVSDYGGNRVVKFTPGGILSVFASTSRPTGLVFDQAGNLYVANSTANQVTKFSSTGTNLGIFANANINSPDGLAFDSAGNFYVANAGNNTVTRYSSTGAFHSVFVSTGLDMPVWIAIQVPEPASLGILGAGLGCLMFQRRRRRMVAN